MSEEYEEEDDVIGSPMNILNRFRHEDRAEREDLVRPMIRAAELASIRGFSIRRAQQLIAASPYRERIHSKKPGRPAWGVPVDKLQAILEQDEEDRAILE